jgi:diketogulonate reductase-like aldo/keto reductase
MIFVTGSSGVRVPGILYGTAWKKEQTEALVTQAVQQGFRGVDTAGQPKHYDEAGVGAALATAIATGLSRGELYVQTKFTPLAGHDPQRIPYDPAAAFAEQVRQSFDTSLRNLRVSHVDSLVLHSPLRSSRQTDEVWRAMESIAAAGGARQIGLSNCYELAELQRLHRSATIKPAVLQNRFYADTGYDREIRAFCRDHAVVYQSFWTLTANPQLLAHGAVAALAAAHRRTPAQILFRYLSQEGIVPLTGTRSIAHMREDLEIFDFELSQLESASITGLL